MKRPRSATVNLKVRMKEPVRARLEKAAKADGISLNAEAVRLIEEGFRSKEDETSIAARAAVGVYASFGGLEGFTVMRLLASAISAIEMNANTKWTDDPETFDRAKQACNTILDLFRPTLDAKFTKETLGSAFYETENEHLGEEVALSVMQEWLERIRMCEPLRDHASEALGDRVAEALRNPAKAKIEDSKARG